MSVQKRKNANDLSILGISEDKTKTIPYNPITDKLKAIYPKYHLHPFIKTMTKLNMQYQMQSDKYQQHRLELDKFNSSIYITLLKEIEVSIEEIERLNDKLIEKDNILKSYKENEKETVRNKMKALEKEINDRINIEKSLKAEVNSYIRQISFYKDKLKLELRNSKDKSKENQCSKEQSDSKRANQFYDTEPTMLKVNRMQNSKHDTNTNTNSNFNNMNNNKMKSHIVNTHSNYHPKEALALIDNSFIIKKIYNTDRQNTTNNDIDVLSNTSNTNNSNLNKQNKAEKKLNKRSVSDLVSSNYVQYNQQSEGLSVKSRNDLKNVANKKIQKNLLMNNSKGINPLITDLNDNYNKEMKLLEYEEGILNKMISDLNNIDKEK